MSVNTSESIQSYRINNIARNGFILIHIKNVNYRMVIFTLKRFRPMRKIRIVLEEACLF